MRISWWISCYVWYCHIMAIDSIDLGSLPTARLDHALHDSRPCACPESCLKQISWTRTKIHAVVNACNHRDPVRFRIHRAYHIVSFLFDVYIFSWKIPNFAVFFIDFAVFCCFFYRPFACQEALPDASPALPCSWYDPGTTPGHRVDQEEFLWSLAAPIHTT